MHHRPSTSAVIHIAWDLPEGTTANDFQKPNRYLTQRYYIRALSKLAPVRKVEGGSERRTGVYTLVHEDSSTEPTHKFSTEVEFQKSSIASSVNPRETLASTLLNIFQQQNQLRTHRYRPECPLYGRVDIIIYINQDSLPVVQEALNYYLTQKDVFRGEAYQFFLKINNQANLISIVFDEKKILSMVNNFITAIQEQLIAIAEVEKTAAILHPTEQNELSPETNLQKELYFFHLEQKNEMLTSLFTDTENSLRQDHPEVSYEYIFTTTLHCFKQRFIHPQNSDEENAHALQKILLFMLHFIRISKGHFGDREAVRFLLKHDFSLVQIAEALKNYGLSVTDIISLLFDPFHTLSYLADTTRPGAKTAHEVFTELHEILAPLFPLDEEGVKSAFDALSEKHKINKNSLAPSQSAMLTAATSLRSGVSIGAHYLRAITPPPNIIPEKKIPPLTRSASASNLATLGAKAAFKNHETKITAPLRLRSNSHRSYTTPPLQRTLSASSSERLFFFTERLTRPVRSPLQLPSNPSGSGSHPQFHIDQLHRSKSTSRSLLNVPSPFTQRYNPSTQPPNRFQRSYSSLSSDPSPSKGITRERRTASDAPIPRNLSENSKSYGSGPLVMVTSPGGTETASRSRSSSNASISSIALSAQAAADGLPTKLAPLLRPEGPT